MAWTFHPAWAIGHTTIPGKISDRLASKGFDSAIWVGQSALDGSPERLTRLAAHEIRHAAQYAFDPQLHYAGQGLARALAQLAVERHLPVPIYSDIPIERDAEAWARDLTVSLYGEELVAATYTNGLDIFRIPQPVQDLAEVQAELRGMLHRHYDDLRALAARKDWRIYEWYGRLAEQVDWAHFDLEPFLVWSPGAKSNAGP